MKTLKKELKRVNPAKKHQSMLASAPVHPWRYTNNQWVRLCIDYLGPFLGKMFLVNVDSYSKWVKVFPVSNSTSQTTINCLKTCLATHVLPQKSVLCKRMAFFISNFPLIIQLQMDAPNDLLELLEKWKGQVV